MYRLIIGVTCAVTVLSGHQSVKIQLCVRPMFHQKLVLVNSTLRHCFGELGAVKQTQTEDELLKCCKLEGRGARRPAAEPVIHGKGRETGWEDGSLTDRGALRSGSPWWQINSRQQSKPRRFGWHC